MVKHLFHSKNKFTMAKTFDFDTMLVKSSDFLKPFAITLTKDAVSAQDLYQETLYRALANREKYQVGTNIKAWLYIIMRNIFINGYRRKSKRQIVQDDSANEFFLENHSNSVQNEGVARLNMKEIWASLFSLPEIFKNPFMLYFEGYKYHEIAQMLNEPLGTIKSRIHFARKLLKSKVKRFA